MKTLLLIILRAGFFILGVIGNLHHLTEVTQNSHSERSEES
ncbi:MAG: hypothetical protein Q8K98_02510 [Bacteroidota bacterium]|nr:hypothetical protein [Bacteroidota bacterium]